MNKSELRVEQRKTQNQLVFSADLHPLLQYIYNHREITDATELGLSLQSLARPEQLSEIPKAVSRLVTAITENQAILIVGDFDADGATGTAVAVRALRMLGAKNVDYKVPNRFSYGYGLTEGLVNDINEPLPAVILTVDNGISSIAGAARAAARGMDVIVSDHHLPGPELPQVYALVNPNQPNDTFPSKHLAGVGVVFYLMLALRAQLKLENRLSTPAPNLGSLLDIVALGTVADVVPLDHNNRILVSHGLARIRAGTAAPGILALLNAGKRHHGRAVASDLGFTVGPRLNAAGRLEDMSRGIECLLCDDLRVAKQIAEELDQLNRERRKLQDSMQQDAILILKDTLENLENVGGDKFGVCLYDADWHLGIVGLVASKIKDKLHKPVVAFAPEGEQSEWVKGSARSIKGIHIRDILAHVDAQQPGLILSFGGHAMAAGLTLAKKNLAEFEKQLNTSIKVLVNPDVFTTVIETDGNCPAEHFNLEAAHALRYAGPWGQGFPEPIFNDQFTVINKHMVGGAHLKLLLETKAGDVIDAIAFFQDESALQGRDQIEVVYRLDVNEFRGRSSLQLMIERIL
ncbi:MAG: single-stranded-DNA-specific exonuclease RecJ [Xanthomonadales bacterium]|nr:single-stranded-DNA-specific exonuclease RecJ [Xanthomonadales bacterium]